MALDELLSRMRREAEAQAALLLTEAKADAERKRQETEAAVLWERSTRLTDRERQLASESETSLEQIRREARQEFLAVRQEAADRIPARAIALAGELKTDPRFLASMQIELDRALQALGGHCGRLLVSSSLAERLRSRVPATTRIEIDDSEIGFQLQSPDGRVTVTVTIGERLRRQAPALRIAAAKMLDRAQ